MAKIDEELIVQNLTDARYKILVALRPLAPAKSAFNLTLTAVRNSIETAALREAIDALKLEE